MGDDQTAREVPFEVLCRDDVDRVLLDVERDGSLRIAHLAPGLAGRVDGDPVGERPDAIADLLGTDFVDACLACRDGNAERTVLAEDGTTSLETTLSPVPEGGPVDWIVGTVRDVTERERLRTEAREADELLDAILDNVPIHLYVKDEAARHLAVSDYYVDQLPFVSERSEMVGLTDDEVLPGEIGVESLRDDRRVIEDGEPLLKKESYVEGMDMWTLTSKFPWERHGEAQGLVGVTIDITRRKQYARELERRTEQLSEFASIISHDLHNPLNAAQGFLRLARESGDPEHFEAVADSIDRSLEITDGLERLVRASDGVEPRSVDVAGIARRAWDDVGSEAGEVTVDSTLSVDADANWLRTLFENLLKNSVEHAGADVTVEVTGLSDAEGFAVEDDGPGIPPEDRPHVFGTDHTTKDGSGGVGLWIVARVADAHGWSVEVGESESGGARF